MHDPILEEVFSAIEDGSPLAEAVESLLEDGLAVDDAELDAATEAVMDKLTAPTRRRYGITLAILPLAAALIGWVMVADQPDEEAQVAEAVAVSVAASPIPHSSRPASATMAQLADTARCLEALRAGQIDGGLVLFEQLVEDGDLEDEALRDLISALHDLALQTPSEDPAQEDILQTLSLGYEAWFDAFGDAPGAGSMHCAYGELLHKTQRLDEAYHQYSTGSRGQHASPCGGSAIVVAESVVRRQVEDGSQPLDSAPGATVWEENLVAAVDQVLTLDPEHPDGTGLAYKAGFTLYATGEHERAIAWFQDAIVRDPFSEEAQRASHLILDSYAQREDWEGLEEWALAYHADEEVGDAEDRAQALSIASRAGQAARMRDGSVDGWLEWLDRYGDDPEAVERVIATLRAENRDAEADALEDAR